MTREEKDKLVEYAMKCAGQLTHDELMELIQLCDKFIKSVETETRHSVMRNGKTYYLPFSNNEYEDYIEYFMDKPEQKYIIYDIQDPKNKKEIYKCLGKDAKNAIKFCNEYRLKNISSMFVCTEEKLPLC